MERSTDSYEKYLKIGYPVIFGFAIFFHLFFYQFAIDTTPYFLILMPIPLLFIEYWNKNYRLICFFIVFGVFTFFAELVGVKTGIIFGEYEYFETLGVRLFETPIVIGVLWSLLLIGSISISEMISKSRYFIIIFSAILMTALDYFIEIFAIDHRYWAWSSTDVPLKNYLTWFLLSIFGAIIFKVFDLYITSYNWKVINLCLWVFFILGVLFV